MSMLDPVAKEEKKVSRDQLHYIVEAYSQYFASEDDAIVTARRRALHYDTPYTVYKSVKTVTAKLPDNSAYVKTDIVDIG